MDSNVAWGYMRGDLFTAVPKAPLIQAGLTEPPFDVELPSGDTRRIIIKPDGVAKSVPILGSPPAVPVKVKNRIRVYTASKLRHAPYVRDEIAKWPEIEVVARWPFSHVDGDLALWPRDCPAHGSIFWTHDAQDVQVCDAVLLFGEEDDVFRGALVEAGMAIALGKHVIVVGTNASYGTWQFHPKVYRVKDMATARSLLTLLAGG